MTNAEIQEIAKAEAARWPAAHEYNNPANVSFCIAEAQRMLKERGYAIAPIAPTRAMVTAGDQVMYGRYGCCFEVAPIYSAMLQEAQEDE